MTTCGRRSPVVADGDARVRVAAVGVHEVDASGAGRLFLDQVVGKGRIRLVETGEPHHTDHSAEGAGGVRDRLPERRIRDRAQSTRGCDRASRAEGACKGAEVAERRVAAVAAEIFTVPVPAADKDSLLALRWLSPQT
jgi:hypothetical protein